MRVALLSPYSWTYPGGVTRHIEALAEQLLASGHDVRVLAPFDHDVRRTAVLHRGARPQVREVPDYLIPIGATVGWPFNGAVSSLAGTPSAVTALRRELDTGGYDVVHLHEPVAPVVGWDTLTYARSPLVGTFHCYSESAPPHLAAALMGARRRLNRLHVRIAVSEAAAWTGRRFYGGEYRVIPNGVAVPLGGVRPPRVGAPGDPLRIAFVGQAVARKGLPILLRAFEALRDEVAVELTLVGVGADEVDPLLQDARGVRALGRVSDEEKRIALERADVLAAPSLGGESFGMVLTEAFAAGTAVVASDIAGYRDVIDHGRNGLLVPRGDATALAETLRDLALTPGLTAHLCAEAASSAERYAWPRVAAEVVGAYEDAVATPEPATTAARLAVRVGALPADSVPRQPARRLPSLEPDPAGPGRRRLRTARRAGLLAAAGALALLSFEALRRVGFDSISGTLLASSPTWVIVALALMCGSMVLRAGAWHAILRAAVTDVRPKLSDALQGTFIGVLMSATLPARLGEPSRALIVARRLGRPREHLPVVLGTLVSQTLLNLLALVILGAIMFSTVGLFAGRQQALVFYALAPFVALCVVLVAPALLRSGLPSRSSRVAQSLDRARQALTRVRSGLAVFSSARHAAVAVTLQLGAWAVQWASCYVLFVALGLDDRANLGAAAAVLFAVNVTAVLPLTPSNLGVFQAACVAVLTGAYGIKTADALGYGIILQAVEVATAVIMGAPALVKEGVSWREVRLRALHSSPVSLPPRGSRGAFETD
jgi:phosphatidylinositol alpha-mannosyltransferase